MITGKIKNFVVVSLYCWQFSLMIKHVFNKRIYSVLNAVSTFLPVASPGRPCLAIYLCVGTLRTDHATVKKEVASSA